LHKPNLARPAQPKQEISVAAAAPFEAVRAKLAEKSATAAAQ
jgi:hypothetical protein